MDDAFVHDEQLWLEALPAAFVILLAFRRKLFGMLDPLNWFLVSRIVPLAIFATFLFLNGSFSYYAVLFLVASLAFLTTLFLSTPNATYEKSDLTHGCEQKIVLTALVILSLKIAILCGASGALPIFSEGGSDAYIDFDNNNKLLSSVLLGLGNADLVLLAFALPLARRRHTRWMLGLALFVGVALGAATGKKSSILNALLAIGLGEYLRLRLLSDQRRYFLTAGKAAVALTVSVGWAVWIYSNTVGGDVNLNVAVGVNFVIFQFAYPFALFSSGELEGFFQTYEVNRATYILHSILSPLGFPAFQASVGPALFEYQTGHLTGNGINPTFVIEGYVLSGVLLPLYAAVVGYAIGRGRYALLRRGSLFRKVTLSALLLLPLYGAALDLLLFMKILFVSVILMALISVFLKLLSAVRS